MVVLHMVGEYSSNTAGPALCCSVLARFFRTKIFFVTTRRIYTFTGSLMRAAGRVTNASTSTDSSRKFRSAPRPDGGRRRSRRRRPNRLGRLPPELIRRVVGFWAHAGFYVRTRLDSHLHASRELPEVRDGEHQGRIPTFHCSIIYYKARRADPH